MKSRISLLVCVMSFAMTVLSFAAQPIPNNYTQKDIYPGDPDFSKLKPTVAASILFNNPPERIVKQLDLYSSETDNGQYYSHYKITPSVTQNGRSLYETHEDVTAGSRFPGITNGDHAIVNGKGLSFGGIFWPEEVMRVTNKQGKLVYYNKIDITSMQPISGQLFPLKVGNDLRFYFTRLHERNVNGKKQFENETGIMEYKVVNRLVYYPAADKAVPGDIYTIEVWESTDLHPKRYLTDIYNYATSLGWYITDTYFTKENKELAVYKMQNWQ